MVLVGFWSIRYLGPVLLLWIGILSLLASAQDSNPPPRYLFAFGDSLTDRDFQLDGPLPSLSNPFGNPPLASQRAEDYGPNWLERLITNETFGLPRNILTYDLAQFGATVDNGLATLNPLIPSFVDQARSFDENFSPSPGSLTSNVSWDADNSLFAVWIGANDLDVGSMSDDVEGHFDDVLDAYYESLERLYDAGARRFLLISAPPLNRAPTFSSSPSSIARVRNALSLFNTRLNGTRLATFRTSHTDTTLSLISAESVWDPILDDPGAYGAPNATCYDKDGTSCLWWDEVHAGYAIHDAMAKRAGEEVVRLGFVMSSEVNGGEGGVGSDDGNGSGSGSSGQEQDGGTSDSGTRGAQGSGQEQDSAATSLIPYKMMTGTFVSVAIAVLVMR